MAVNPGTGEPATSGDDSRGIMTHWRMVLFCVVSLSLAGIYAARSMPSSVFPETNFPRVVVLVDNGAMPADAMMASITRPIEEALKNIPGALSTRSATGRGAAEVNVFFDWSTDMLQAELFVLGRIGEVRSSLPASAQVAVHRLTFAAFPIIGISLTSQQRTKAELWETARYDLQPLLLRVPGVARIHLVGGREPEIHVQVDPARLEQLGLSATDVSQALASSNLFTSAGMHEENNQLYLTVVDNRLQSIEDIESVIVAQVGSTPILLKEVGRVVPGEAPQFNVVTADGAEAVLLNVYPQPDSDTIGIADALLEEVENAKGGLAADLHLAFFYDQSQFVREGVRSVWESIYLGLLLSALVLFAFLRDLRSTFVAALVIPVTVLLTLVGLRLMGMGFNLMTLGGIAAAIGMIIDDAIVVVEAIHTERLMGHRPRRAVNRAIRQVGPPLVGSTLTPIVVFLPLSLLDGVPGVFFRALAITMVFALLSSLLLAVTWTPVLGTLVLRPLASTPGGQADGGPILSRVIGLYEIGVRGVLARRWTSLLALALLSVGGVNLYSRLDSGFLPDQDEGAFVIDYFSRPGTSLSETDRMLGTVEDILRATPEVDSYSRRTGARLALAIAEPNTGDFLVKLRSERERSTEEVIDELRSRINAAEPALTTEFPGVLGDLIGDLTWSPDPVEIKIFSNDVATLRRTALEISAVIEDIPGVVDVNDGLVVAGPTLRFRVTPDKAARLGLTAEDVGRFLHSELLGDVSSQVLRGDRLLGVRVVVAPMDRAREAQIAGWPMRGSDAASGTLKEIAALEHDSGILEMHREDLRQLLAVSARFSGIDLGSGIAAIQDKIASSVELPADTQIEFGGLFEQQQESFHNLSLVLGMAIFLVFGVLLFEFRSFGAPIAITLGALLALIGVVAALLITDTSLNIVSFLGGIIGVGIVAKNGILMLDCVEHLRKQGLSDMEALVQSGRRRLRPVLMTSMTTFLGLLPLAWGVGAGADMLRPLAVAILGALAISLVLSLIATPLFYSFSLRLVHKEQA